MLQKGFDGVTGEECTLAAATDLNMMPKSVACKVNHAFAFRLFLLPFALVDPALLVLLHFLHQPCSAVFACT